MSGQTYTEQTTKTRRKGKKSLAWNKDPEILARMERVEALVLAGHSNLAIAKFLKVSEPTVRRDRLRIAQLWRDKVGADIASMRGRSFSQYARIAKQADQQYKITKDPQFLRIVLETERSIVNLLGTQLPAAQTAQREAEQESSDLSIIPTAELIREAQESRDLARRLLDGLQAESANGDGKST